MGEMSNSTKTYIMVVLAILAAAYFVGLAAAIFMTVIYLIGRHFWIKHSVDISVKGREIYLEWDEFDDFTKPVRKREIFNF